MNTRPVGTTTSRRTPLAWFRASSMAKIPLLRLSRSMFLVASSSEKSINVGSYESIHWSSGSPHAGEWLRPDVRAKGDSLWVLSTTATMPGDPSAMSLSIRTMSRAVIWVVRG